MKLINFIFIMLLFSSNLVGSNQDRIDIGPESFLGFNIGLKEITPNQEGTSNLQDAAKSSAGAIFVPSADEKVRLIDIYLKTAQHEVTLDSIEQPANIDSSTAAPFELLAAKMSGNALYYLYRDQQKITITVVDLKDGTISAKKKEQIESGDWMRGSIEITEAGIEISLDGVNGRQKRILRNTSGVLKTLQDNSSEASD